MPVTLTDAQRDELRSILQGMKAELAAIRLDAIAAPFSDEERETFRGRLAEQSDVDLVSTLLTFQKLVEQQATGHQRELLERQTVVITTLLQRFAPVALLDALAVWEEETAA
jgi:hypothetical protein